MRAVQREILEEFASVQSLGDPVPHDLDIDPSWLRKERRRQRDRERKQRARDEMAIAHEILRRAALRMIREAEGVPELCTCACGCGRVFPGNATGRPRRFATVMCRVIACITSKLAKRRSAGT